MLEATLTPSKREIAASLPSNRRIIGTTTIKRVTVTMYRLPDTDEYLVRVLVDASALPDADYFTNDLDDALGTAKVLMISQTQALKSDPCAW